MCSFIPLKFKDIPRVSRAGMAVLAHRAVGSCPVQETSVSSVAMMDEEASRSPNRASSQRWVNPMVWSEQTRWSLDLLPVSQSQWGLRGGLGRARSQYQEPAWDNLNMKILRAVSCSRPFAKGSL